jgi:hypothetical protein
MKETPMTKLTRRDALMVAGAAGVVPLLGAGPFRRKRTSSACEPIFTDAVADIQQCDLYVAGVESVTVVDATGVFQTYTSASNAQKFYVIYQDVTDKMGKWRVTNSPLPLSTDASELQVWVPLTFNGGTFNKHEFQIQIAIAGTTPMSHVAVQVICKALYSNGSQIPSCCFSCGGKEYCIAKGNCIICGKVKVCC